MTAQMGSWRESARCAQSDPEVWFPEKGGQPFTAKRICLSCPVRVDCLTWAMENPVEGVWGGTTLPERRALAKGRKYDPTYSQAGEREASIARYHADGLYDREIGIRMRLHTDTVGRIRRALGLPANGPTAKRDSA